MAIVEMNKITIVGLETEKKAIIDGLMKMGVVEFTAQAIEEEFTDVVKADGNYEKLNEYEGCVSELEHALSVLNKYAPYKKKPFEGKRQITSKEFENIISRKEEISNKAQEISSLEEKIMSLRTEENRLKNLLTSLTPWESLDVKLELEGTKKTATSLATVPESVDVDQLIEEFNSKVEYGELILVGKDNEQSYLFLIVHAESYETAVEFLKTKGWSKVSFKGLDGSAAQNIEKINQQITELDLEKQKVVETIKEYNSYRQDIEAVFDYYTMQTDQENQLNKVIKTQKAFVIKGWVPKNTSEAVEKFITDKFITTVEIEEPAKDEAFPIEVHNNKFAEAVEPITKMYSLPNVREIDPNAIMAPFYVIFFGLMLSDAGYGILLTLLSGILLLKYELESNRKFIKLLFYCGLSTVFWGAMFGGWFGNLVPFLAEKITGKESALLSPIWFNPVDDPERMLQYALLIGVIHIFVGFLVKGINLAKKKKYLDILFDVVFWYILFTGFIFIVLPYIPKMDIEKVQPLVDIGGYLMLIGAILLILTQGRTKKNIFARLFGGISSLYDLIGFLSDVLSYSRLLALGLATSVIASIINDMGSMGGLDNIIGIAVFIVVFILGHLFNFAINALGAYVHSSRLQYIEFFGKFYEGGGVPFTPLKQDTKYISIKY